MVKVLLQFKNDDEADDFFRGINKAFIEHHEKIPDHECTYVATFEIRRAGGRTKQFSETDVNLMRSMRDDHNLTYTEIAKRFGTSRQTVMKYLKE